MPEPTERWMRSKRHGPRRPAHSGVASRSGSSGSVHAVAGPVVVRSTTHSRGRTNGESVALAVPALRCSTSSRSRPRCSVHTTAECASASSRNGQPRRFMRLPQPRAGAGSKPISVNTVMTVRAVAARSPACGEELGVIRRAQARPACSAVSAGPVSWRCVTSIRASSW